MKHAHNFEDLTGKRFGRVTVVKYYGQDYDRNTYWWCKCDCGNEFIARGFNLKAGKTKSCGCYRSEKTRERNYKRFRCTI